MDEYKQALLYDKLENKKVRCNICRHNCVIDNGKMGFCRTRVNARGVLYTLIYSKVSSMHSDPIEKKPLFHFYPGSFCFSMGTIGCNFRCPGCQNYEISHERADAFSIGVEIVTPKEAIALTLHDKCQGISWTYNEPTIWFEYTLDCAKLAKQKNLYTVYVTNGYITPQALEMISPYLDAFRVDIKGFSEETYKKISGVNALAGVLDSTKLAKKKYNMHVECVTNVTPTINDDEGELRKLAAWIKNELGPETPWHVTAFYPYLELSDLPPTPVSKLERVREIGLEEGLEYVYIGNAPGHAGENTYCGKCKNLLIKRLGYSVSKPGLDGNKCLKCGAPIPLVTPSSRA